MLFLVFFYFSPRLPTISFPLSLFSCLTAFLWHCLVCSVFSFTNLPFPALLSSYICQSLLLLSHPGVFYIAPSLPTPVLSCLTLPIPFCFIPSLYWLVHCSYHCLHCCNIPFFFILSSPFSFSLSQYSRLPSAFTLPQIRKDRLRKKRTVEVCKVMDSEPFVREEIKGGKEEVRQGRIIYEGMSCNECNVKKTRM